MLPITDPWFIAFILAAMPTLGGTLAVGAVLAIKIRRRLEGPAPAGIDVHPANPLSDGDARKMWRRYLLGAGAVLVVLLAAGIVLTAWRG